MVVDDDSLAVIGVDIHLVRLIYSNIAKHSKQIECLLRRQMQEHTLRAILRYSLSISYLSNPFKKTL